MEGLLKNNEATMSWWHQSEEFGEVSIKPVSCRVKFVKDRDPRLFTGVSDPFIILEMEGEFSVNYFLNVFLLLNFLPVVQNNSQKVNNNFIYWNC